MIASLAEKARGEGIPVMIVTGDRDAFQLVGDGISVMATARGITETKIYDEQAVIDRYGIGPELIPDFYGLKGDTSDNIPGVPGIGEKTASDLLQRFGDLETILDSVDEICGAKRKENLVNHAEDARVSKVLATVKRDIPVDIDLQAELAKSPDRGAAARDLPRLRAARPAAAARGGARGPRGGERPAARGADRGRAARSPAGAVADVAGLPGERAGAGRRGAGHPRGRADRRDRGLALRRLGRGGRRRWPARSRTRASWSRRPATRPVIAHDAKALLAVPQNLVFDTEIGAYLLDPARRGYPLHELAEERGMAVEADDDVAAEAALIHELAAPPARAAGRARPGRPAQRHRAAARARAALHGDRGHQARRRAARHGRAPHHRPVRDPRARDLGAGRRGVRHRLAAAARPHPVREARPVAQAPRQDRLLHRRARAAGDPRRARDHPQDRAVPGAVQARADLLRDAQGAHLARRRPAAHDVLADGRGDRPAVARQPEPAEHPDPHGDRPRDPPLLHRRAGQPAAVGRLRPGRAAHPRPHRRRGRPARDLPARRGRPHRDRVARVRPARRAARRRHALEGQDGQLRDRLRAVAPTGCPTASASRRRRRRSSSTATSSASRPSRSS